MYDCVYNLYKSTFELFHRVFTAMQNVQLCQNMTCHHQEGLMSNIRAGVCNCGPEFHLNWTLPKIQKAFLKTFPMKMKPAKWPAKDKKKQKPNPDKVSPCSFHALYKKSFYHHEVRVNLDFSDSVDSRHMQV